MTVNIMVGDRVRPAGGNQWRAMVTEVWEIAPGLWAARVDFGSGHLSAYYERDLAIVPYDHEPDAIYYEAVAL